MNCEWCEEPITSKYGKKFCSLSCGAKQQGAKRSKKEAPQAACQECGNQFAANIKGQRFCSRSCSGAYNGRKRVKHGRYTVGRTCTDCPTPISRNSTGGRCRPCAAALRGKALVAAWTEGSWDGSAAQGLSKTIRTHLLEVANHQCSKCGWGEVHPVTGNVPLQVNHIDGDAYNNQSANLEVLCPNCHSLTHNFGSLNKNGTRRYRH